MKILFDTCEFLWFISGNPALSLRVKQEAQKASHEVFLSVVSLWEIIIKYNLGKLSLPQTPDLYIPAQRQLHRITSLSLEESSVKRLIALPTLHRDPFDRILVCQAQDYGMHLASSDPVVAQYPVKML